MTFPSRSTKIRVLMVKHLEGWAWLKQYPLSDHAQASDDLSEIQAHNPSKQFQLVIRDARP